MERGPAGRALRGIETLYATGPVGALGDAQLVERFLSREGRDREDAFAAIVQRHGPMVLALCRRSLASAADADDAFQAVFLVLARRARSVRKLDSLRSWLHGVAVRTAGEVRKRSARIRAREGGTLVDPPSDPPAPEDLFELRALLDEELGRLPSRYREPLLLCELEGASRRDAAQRLGLPEGTLSTRLARGRAMLRDRLVRRGVAVAALAGIAPEPARASVHAALADAATRLALTFTNRGAAAGEVPAAVAALAEGVLSMIASAKLRAALAAVASLGLVASLAAGLAWGFTKPAVEPDAAPVADEAEKPMPDSKPDPIMARGLVVDEAGVPVAGAEVRVGAYSSYEATGTTGPDGTFAVPIAKGRFDGRTILVRAGDGRKVGVFTYGRNQSRPQADDPARVVVRPGRDVSVHVTGADKAGIPGAMVEVVSGFAILDREVTGTDGVARVTVPTDAKVSWITAQKGAVGFDFAEFGAIDPQGRSQGGAAASELPDSVALALDHPRTVRIKAVDDTGKPAPGVNFYVWLLAKEGRKSDVNYSSPLHQATTDADGIATFDWLPQSKKTLIFFPAEGYAHRRVQVEEGQTDVPVVQLARTVTVRGRVTLPDGTPANDVSLRAYGTGRGIDHGQATARTAADGTYEMSLPPDELYAVYVEEKEWAAPARLDVLVRRGQPVEGVDFRLGPGTLLTGTITVGPKGAPAAGQFIRVDESGEAAPEELRETGDNTYRKAQRQFGARTDAQGRYAIRVGPGTYTLMGPPRTTNEKITVANEPEIVRDFRMPRPEKGPLSGKVVRASDGAAVPGAKVDVAAANLYTIPFTAQADADGRFRTERGLDKTYLWARSPDGSLGAIVEIDSETPEVEIRVAPTATAVGVLLDEGGHIAANQKLEWGRRIYLNEKDHISTYAFAPRVVTDAEGRFTLPSLVVGQEYEIHVMRDNRIPQAGAAHPAAPGLLDLGKLQVGAYRPKEDPRTGGEMSSFRPDAPDAGATAPAVDATTLDGEPLTLKDFAGKYVLLDFWATWCGPCLAEIPQLQAVHDAFGKDDRFAILSLSVDEGIDAPRAFQEKRRLPWAQGFLSGGLNGPKPGAFGVEAIPALVLVGPDGKIVSRGMRGAEIRKAVARALGKAE